MKISLIVVVLFISSLSFALDKINIGFIAGFSESDVETSIELERGIQFFLKTNKAAADRLNVIKIDNKSDAKETYRVMDEAISKQKLSIFIGIPSSNEALVAAKIAEEKKVVFITPFATNPKVTESNNFTFRTCYSDVQQGKTLAEHYKNELMPKKVLLLVNRDSLYSVGLAQSFKAEFPKTGPEIIQITYSTPINVEEIKSEMKDFKPDVFFIPDHSTNIAFFAKTIMKGFPKAILLAGDGLGDGSLFEIIKGKKEMNVFYTTHWDYMIKNSVSQKFVKEYEKIYSDHPTTGAATTYEAVGVLWEALLLTKFNDNSVVVRDALKKVSFIGPTGTIKFEQSNTPKKQIILMTIKNNKHLVYRVYE